jgi:acetyltransferase-like isoleucine patch superfamily enzyme
MGPVKIGNRTSTKPFAKTLGSRHAMCRKKEGTTVIENNVWRTTGSIIHFGVKTGDNAVVGPGFVLTKHVPSSVQVLGMPVRISKEIRE